MYNLEMSKGVNVVKIIIPEKKEEWVSAAVTPSMAKAFERAAKKHGVSKSDLLRFLIENFLAGNLENSEATPPKNEINLEIIKVVS